MEPRTPHGTPVHGTDSVSPGSLHYYKDPVGSRWDFSSRSVSECDVSSPESCPTTPSSSVLSCYEKCPNAEEHFYVASPSSDVHMPSPTLENDENIALLTVAAPPRPILGYNPHNGGVHPALLNLTSAFGPDFDVVISIESNKHKRYRCAYPGCATPFKRPEHLRRHAKIHTGEREYQCDVEVCRKRFSRSDNLKQHRTLHQKPPKSSRSRSIYVPGLK